MIPSNPSTLDSETLAEAARPRTSTAVEYGVGPVPDLLLVLFDNPYGINIGFH